ncbi:hypothetical protein SUDANB6_00050 [Streptomyces sp. enrichment culture]|uniref:IclR family transcriptional regulator n=1 Tax=Streptomyces sp. enrichment culture TaxID=1795815 RepID=UPI003F55C9ED
MSAPRNALRVLEEVVAAGPGVTAREICAALRLPPATTYRLLNLLVAEEYLVRLPDLRGFAVGRRAARLAPPMAPRLSTAARAVLADLRERTRWGVHLAAYPGGRLALADPDPDHPPADATLLARHLHASSLGKLLLAEQHGIGSSAPPTLPWSTEQQGGTGRGAPPPLLRLTERTVTNRAELARELVSVAERQVARQLGELHSGLGCLAVPVRDPASGALIAGLALCTPADRVDALAGRLTSLLRTHADRLAPLLA